MKRAPIRIFLLTLFLFSFLLRGYKVTSIPPALSWDEVSIGYNAYSILKSGFDEHGRFLPVDTFIAYGDYKPPLSIYLTVPFVAIFGLSELAVRLPSVLFGSLTVILLFYLVRKLFADLKGGAQEYIAMTAAILLSISPWHIQLSRAGFEANISLFFVVLGVFFVLKTKDNLRYLWICWIPFVLSMYTFNSSRYAVPLLSLALIIYMWKSFMKVKKQVAVGMCIAFVLILPMIPHLLSKEARLRFTEVNIFSDVSLVQKSNDRMSVDGNSVLSKILHNRRISYAKSYLLHFFDHFDPRFLFIRGDGNPKFSLQDTGQLYFIELPFLVLGFIWLFRDRRSLAWLLLVWLVAAIVPAATARETPHALRIENGLPVFIIATGYGLFRFIHYIKLYRRVVIIIIVCMYAGSVAFFAHNYLNHYSSEFSGEWQYGYKQAFEMIAPIEDKYSGVVITEAIGRPYMYLLFYKQVDPNQLNTMKSTFFDADGFYHVTNIEKYAFEEKISSFEKGKLYIVPPGEVHPKARIIGTVYRLNGDPALVIFDL